MAHRFQQEQYVRQNLKGIIRCVFTSHENFPDFLDVVDVTSIFSRAIVSLDVASGNYFIKFHLHQFSVHPNFDSFIRFLRYDFFHATVDGLPFFSYQEYNPYDNHYFMMINMNACLYYLMSEM